MNQDFTVLSKKKIRAGGFTWKKTFIYSAFHKTFDRRFARFVVNFMITSLRNWEFQYVTVNERANFESVKKG